MNLIHFMILSFFHFNLKKSIYNYEFILKQKYLDFQQIRGVYSIFNYNQNEDYLRYGSKNRRKIKNEKFLKNTIQDHHIIPKTFKKHVTVKFTNFNVICSNNLIMMPSMYASYILNNSQILYHKPHIKYNNYVKKQLDYIRENHLYKDDAQYNLWLLLKHLEHSILTNNKTLPWN